MKNRYHEKRKGPPRSKYYWQSLKKIHRLGKLMQDLATLVGRGKRKEKISSKEVIFTKAAESSSEPIPEITSDFESECETQEPLHPIPKLIGVEPAGTPNSLISLADLTLNMADLTLNSFVPKKIKQTSKKVSHVNAIKKKTETKSPAIPDLFPGKKTDSSAEKLLLTLMEEVKSLKEHIKVPSDNSTLDCYIKLKCSTYGSADHLTKEHPEQIVVKKTLAKLKTQSSQTSTSRKAIKIPKPFIPCKYRGFNDHHSNECEYYPRCDICGSIAHEPYECNKKTAYGRKPKIARLLKEIWDTEGYRFVNCYGITFTKVAYVNGLKHNLISISQLCDANFKVLFTKTQGTIFNKNNEVVLVAPRRRDVYVIDIKMENLNEVKVKELRSDNGTEFKNHKLEEFYDEKGISHNFSSPCTPEQNGVAERRNKTLIEAARTILNSAKLPKNFGERGRSPDISYFHVFGCPVHIYNHRDHLGKFDEKADDGFFLGYSLVAKAFRVFNIRRQELKETFHVTFSEDDEAISQTSTEGDAINFNENRSFSDDEFLKSRSKVNQCSSNIDYFPYIPGFEPIPTINTTIPENNITPTYSPILHDAVSFKEPSEFTNVDDHPAPNESDNLEPADIQDNVIKRWSREKHIELVNIIREPLDGITTRSRIRDSEAASAHECLFVNFHSKIEPKKLMEALNEEGWIIEMQEESFKETWCGPKPHGKTFIRTKWIWKNKMHEHGVVIKNKARLVTQGYNQQERIDYEEIFAPCISKWYQANPKESYLVAVKKIFRYLKGTPHLGLWYPKGSGFDLKAYFNSDYAGCNLDIKSTSRGCQILSGKLVCWSAKKQSFMAMSSVEAEYVIVVGCCAQVLWIKIQLADYDVLYEKVLIFCDNTSAIAISNNLVLHSRTKHIDIRYYFIRDHILKGDIELHFVPTDLQLADIFTKPLAEPSF
ncbi:retrovirus-related pol polyprotein from transposon TNT 1-94 [Tanacetum coccineum]